MITKSLFYCYEKVFIPDYAHAKRVCKDFEIKNSGEYHDLHVQSDTFLLADLFENYGNMCHEIYELDPAKFLSAQGLAWAGALKKTKVKLDLVTDTNMSLMVEKCIRGGVCHSRYVTELVLKKVHRVIKFTQNAWQKPYTDMNTDLRKKAKNDFEKYFFKLMNNAVGKAMGNVRNHTDIQLVKTERRRNYLVSEPNDHTTKLFTKSLLTIELKKQSYV